MATICLRSVSVRAALTFIALSCFCYAPHLHQSGSFAAYGSAICWVLTIFLLFYYLIYLSLSMVKPYLRLYRKKTININTTRGTRTKLHALRHLGTMRAAQLTRSRHPL